MLADLIAALPPAWVAEAEISLPLNGTAGGLSFFFESAAEFADFLAAAGAPAGVARYDAGMRERFALVPRRWVKVQAGGRGGPEGGRRFSQYFQVHPSDTYPLTTLRLFLRACGGPEVAGLEELLRPALERDDTVWGLVLKHTGDAVRPRLSCRIPRALLPQLLQLQVAAGRLPGRQGDAYRGVAERVTGGESVYVSFDPAVAGSCVLDFERVPSDAVPGAAALFPRPVVLGYAKCRLGAPGDAPSWTAYLPYAAWRAYRDVPADPAARLAAARAYYERTNDIIVRCFGGTYQAGWLRGKGRTAAAADSNVQLAARAGVAAGQRVLDVGAGRGGPACDIAIAIPGVTVDAVTLVPAEAAAARRLAQERGCEGRVAVIAADFHHLPVAAARYDHLLLLESSGYAVDLAAACAEWRRVLRPGASLYVKDVFARSGAVDDEERFELLEFDRTYAQHTRKRAELAAALQAAGFRVVVNAPFGDEISMDHYHAAMFSGPGRLSEFGREHFRRFGRLPVEWGEIRAVTV